MILVTGATGFVGSYIVRELVAKGQKVRAFKRSGSSTNLLKDIEGKFEWFDGDVLDIVSLENAMQGVNKVYHSAAMISFLKSEVPQMYKINIEGTANVVNAALAANIDKLLHVSSVSAFGRYEINEIIDENRKWKEDKDNTHYAISKFRAELEVWRGQEEGLTVAIVNPSTVLGFGNWKNGSSQIFKNVYDGISFYPVGVNGFVGVEDVARACIAVMDSPLHGERFIINGENMAFKDLFELIGKGFGIKAPQKPIPPILATIGWIYFAIKSKLLNQQPLITRETVQYTARNYRYNNEKIKRELNFEFTPINKVVEETCKKYLQAEGKR
jgi:dihydroflavonol-4-reductase